MNEKTLRREKIGLCFDCKIAPHRDTSARKRRTEYDWTRPIPDQYAGQARSTIRRFIESGDLEYILDDETPPGVAGMLNASIASLGLSGECYAEQRTNNVVLRRSSRVTEAG